MRAWFSAAFAGYKLLPSIVWQVVGVQFLVELVNSAFTLILNLHLRKTGFADEEIAALTAFRYLGILVFALPLGLYIRTHRIKPFFFLSLVLIPCMSWLLLLSAHHHLPWAARVAYFLWGSGLMMIQVGVVPFIIRNCQRDTDPEALSLSYSTFSLGLIVSSLLISGLTAAGSFSLGSFTLPFDEYHILLLLSCLCLLGFPLVMKLKEARPARAPGGGLIALVKTYDWWLIAKALAPTTLIAIGAGFTIPFMNLFFNSVFGMDSTAFSLMGMFTAVLVVLGAFLVPVVRRRLGYGRAIFFTQSTAVLLLVGLLLTQPLAGWQGAYALAVGCYMLRSPLMNMAAPMTNDLIMRYVGPGNREMVSALFSSIWSGSAYFSSKMFQALRSVEMEYWKIFTLTAVLYAVGIVAYMLLVRDFNRRQASRA